MSGKSDFLVLFTSAVDVKLLIDELSVIEEVQEDKIALISVSMGGTFLSLIMKKRKLN